MMSRFDDRYDVALSYSRDDREIAQAIASACREQGIRVFFDEWAAAQLWDKELFAHLHDLYRSSARYCIPLVSYKYVYGMCTKHGSEATPERSFEGEADHLLPIRLDDSYVPALRLSGPYLDIRKMSPAEIACLLRKKLDLAPAGSPETAADSMLLSNSANLWREEQASEWIPGFNRRVTAHGSTFTEPEILGMLDRIWPTSTPRERLRFGTDLRRLVVSKHIVLAGPVYTAWRVGNRVFLSMLPTVGHGHSGHPRQQTLEFEVKGTPPEGLTLVAGWVGTDPVWRWIHYSELRDAFGEVVADRSGCNMVREVALEVLLLRGAQFAFPVAPVAGPPERFCRWMPRLQRGAWPPSDWDRDPRIVDSRRSDTWFTEPMIGVDGLALLHRATGAGVMITTLHSGWSVNAVYALQDALNIFLPTRHVLQPLDAGCMRLCVFLSRSHLHFARGLYDLEAYEANHPLDAIRLAHAAIARAVAAQREIPIAPPSCASALPRLHPKVSKAFRACEEALGERDHPAVTGHSVEEGASTWEMLADSSHGRRMNIRQESYPFELWRIDTRSELAAFIEKCENQTLAP